MADMVPTLSVLGPFERGSFFFQDGKDMDMDF